MKSCLTFLGITVLLLCSCVKEDPGPDEVFIDNLKFTPSSIIVPVGTTVTWTNKESTNHTVTSDTLNLFDSDGLSKKETFSYTFTNAGNYPYHCRFHTGMKGSVIVE